MQGVLSLGDYQPRAAHIQHAYQHIYAHGGNKAVGVEGGIIEPEPVNDYGERQESGGAVLSGGIGNEPAGSQHAGLQAQGVHADKGVLAAMTDKQAVDANLQWQIFPPLPGAIEQRR